MASPRFRPLTAVALLVMVVAACGGGSDGGDVETAPAPSAPSTQPAPPGPPTGEAPAPASTSAPAPTPTEPTGEPPPVRATKVADFDQALALAPRAGDDTLYVVEKGGRIKALGADGRVASTLVLDLSRAVSSGGEQGLLGAAFSPDGDLLYVNYTDTAGDTRVMEYAFAGGRADPASRRELLSVDQPFGNHNGGHLLFGPDGFLYIGLGDGGGGGDPRGNAQRLDTLLGKILRIDPRPASGRPYTVPPDNPFAGRDGARPEIWAYGLRNPWRFSFDRATGALWIGDVGQGAREEVSAAGGDSKGGENYGWNLFEGTQRFSGGDATGLVPPVYDYAKVDGNCAVTGGHVYRGERIAGLQGRYIFADYCKGEVLTLVPGGDGLEATPLSPRLEGLASFGEDNAGELYALSLSSGLYRLDRG